MSAAADVSVTRDSQLLHEAGEIRHPVYPFTASNGADDDWASWYWWWLLTLPGLPDLLGVKPVRRAHLHARDARQVVAQMRDEQCEPYYAGRPIEYPRANALSVKS